jgi:hypothetical protein
VSFQRLSRNNRSNLYGPGRYNLAELVVHWLEINCWTAADFALLSRGFCSQSGGISAREIAAFLSGSRPELIPRYFQAFAAVDRGITELNQVVSSGGSQPVPSLISTFDDPYADRNLLGRYTSSICIDDSAQQASWWFAVYCGEPWAIASIQPLELKPSSINILAKELPSLLRSAISRQGLDPVAYIREAAQALQKRTSLLPNRYVDWILEYYSLNQREIRLALPFSLLVLETIGLRCHSLHGIKPQIENAIGLQPTPFDPHVPGRPRSLVGAALSVASDPVAS